MSFIESLENKREKDIFNFQKKFRDKLILSGLPHKKNESYRYTSLENILGEGFELSTKTKISESLNDKNYDLVFINGHLAFNNIKSKNIVVGELSESFDKLIDSQSFLETFNVSVLTEAIDVKILNNCEEKIKIKFINDHSVESNTNSLRVHFNVGISSKLNVYEVFESSEKEMANLISYSTYFSIEKNSQVEHIIHDKLSHNSKLFHNVKADVQRDSTFKQIGYFANSLFSRSEYNINLNGEGAHCALFALFCTWEKRQSDHYTKIYHNEKHTTSEQFYKGLLSGNSRAIFNGQIYVDENCSGVDSTQLNKNILLDDKSKIYTSPTLLIDNEDVKCAHGATVGQFSFDELFYMQSRGLSLKKSRHFLAKGFAYQVLAKTSDLELLEVLLKDFENVFFKMIGED